MEGGTWNMMRATTHTQVGCPDPGEFLFTSSYLITNSMASTENLHVVVFSAQKLCLCPSVIQAGSGWWRVGWGTVLQAGLRRAMGTQTSCSGPGSTCCVDSNYSRTKRSPEESHCFQHHPSKVVKSRCHYRSSRLHNYTISAEI